MAIFHFLSYYLFWSICQFCRWLVCFFCPSFQNVVMLQFQGFGYANRESGSIEVWIFGVSVLFLWWHACGEPPPCTVTPGITTPARLCW